MWVAAGTAGSYYPYFPYLSASFRTATTTATNNVVWNSTTGSSTWPGTHNLDPRLYLQEVQGVLTYDLLKPEHRVGWTPDNPMYGHCYHAAEALFHLLGGRAAGYKPVRAKDDHGITHWWLEHKTGGRLDPTVSQYLRRGETPPYERGRGGGFLTKLPSKRAAEVIRRVRAS